MIVYGSVFVWDSKFSKIIFSDFILDSSLIYKKFYKKEAYNDLEKTISKRLNYLSAIISEGGFIINVYIKYWS